MNHLSRRSFLKTAAIATTGVALSARSWGQVAGANGDLRVAIIGLNGKGKDHFNAYRQLPGVRIVAICDVDSAILDRTMRDLAQPNQLHPDRVTDLRDLLKRSDIDVISIATPNHQHALQAIWSMQAGKDVYLEKPVCHNIWEGQQIVAAAKKYNRIVQSGTQSRSSTAIADALTWMKAGNIGKLNAVYGTCYKNRASIGLTTGPQPVPETVNYDLWLGPAPMAPLRRKNLHYDWHWQWATGNGDIGNQGNHQMDVARRFVGESAFPRHVFSVGGRFGYVDDGETPNTLITLFDYATAPLIFEVRGLPTGRAGGRGGRGARGGAAAPASTAAPAAAPILTMTGSTMEERLRSVGVGNIAVCEGGYIVVSVSAYSDYSNAQAFDRDGKLLKEFTGITSNYANFVGAVRSRKNSDLNAPINEGRLSSSLCLLANISHRTGRNLKPGEIRDQINGRSILAESFGRMTEHLQANNVNLDETPATCGAPLSIDAASETFTGENRAAATAQLSREYRAPFVVPQMA